MVSAAPPSSGAAEREIASRDAEGWSRLQHGALVTGSTAAALGVLGGSGFYECLSDTEDVEVSTP